MNIEEQLSKNYKPSSVRTYGNTLKLIFHKMDYTLTEEPISKKFDLSKFFDKIKNLKCTTQRNYISALIALLKSRGETKSSFYNALSEKRDFLNDGYTSGVGTKSISEKNNWIGADKLKTVYEEKILKVLKTYGLLNVKGKKMKLADLSDSQKDEITGSVILAFYYSPFQDLENNKTGVLRNDIATLKLCRSSKLPNDNENYLWVKSPSKISVFLNNYKTDHSYGPSEIELGKDMVTILKNYVSLFEIKNDEKIFGLNKHGITNLLIKFSKKNFKTSLGTQMLRKIYLTEKFGDVKKEKEEVAKNMGHSVSTQSDVYTKDD